MLDSFLMAQKVSVRKTLRRSFLKYVNYGEETNQLLMHQIQNLIIEVEKYNHVSLCEHFMILSFSTRLCMEEL